MPSFQQSAGAGKAAKFVAANPLGPMADPFAGLVREITIGSFGSDDYGGVMEASIFS